MAIARRQQPPITIRSARATALLRTLVGPGRSQADVIEEALGRRNGAADVRRADPASERDSWIAATALVHDMAVVTRNVVSFERTGVRLVDPWKPVVS